MRGGAPGIVFELRCAPAPAPAPAPSRATLVFHLLRASFPRSARPNLPLALGGDCVHTFARSKFLLSRIYGDVPARD
jgi:hypothetical protein